MKVTLTFDSFEEMEAFRGSGKPQELSAPAPVPVQQIPTPVAPAPVPVQQIPTPIAPAPVPVQNQLPQGLPTTAVTQEYTMDQLAVAASGLVNMGKQPQLMDILARFGVQTMVDLPKEQYGAFAMALKAEGAVI